MSVRGEQARPYKRARREQLAPYKQFRGKQARRYIRRSTNLRSSPVGAIFASAIRMADRRQRTASAVAQSFAIIAAGMAILWACYLARGALLLVYVSVLLAIGFGPVVHAIEHQQR